MLAPGRRNAKLWKVQWRERRTNLDTIPELRQAVAGRSLNGGREGEEEENGTGEERREPGARSETSQHGVDSLERTSVPRGGGEFRKAGMGQVVQCQVPSRGGKGWS